MFTYDDGLLINAKTGHIYCNTDRDGYIRVRVSGREFRAHRLIWEMHYGTIPDGMLVDHIDGDPYNNRIENLRLATRQQNNMNKAKILGNCTTGSDLPKGVTRTANGTFRARITVSNRTESLGTFKTIEEASAAYKEAAEILFGEFAKG